MDLEHISKEAYRKINSEGMRSPSALALVGSRPAGYHEKESDYDFNAIFDNFPGTNYINFFLNSMPISIKTQSKRDFEEKLNEREHTPEKSRFAYFPYNPIKNYRYLREKEIEARKGIISEFESRLPEEKDVKATVRDVAEYPLISASLSCSEYGSKLRRINASGCNLIERMKPKYRRELEDMGYFISQKDEVVFRNKGNKKPFKKGLLDDINDKYVQARERGLTPGGYFLGEIWFLSQIPLETYNVFENFPRVEKNGEGYHYSGPSIQEFLNKRKNLVPFEKLSERIKKEIVHNFTK